MAAVDTKSAVPAAAPAKEADTKAPAPSAVDQKGVPDRKSTVVVVTGATGFIASWIVKQLLEGGYSVRGTATSLKPEKISHLTSLPGAADRLKMFEANLLTKGAFDAICAGSHYVLHTASPYSMDVKDAKKDLLEPALNGTLNVLESVQKAGTVKRVVLTSSVAAITDCPDPNHTYTEADWNVSSSLTRNPYYYSKKMAEEAAWKFAGENRLDLVVINPFVVLGPCLNSVENTSVEIIRNLLTKKFPAVLDLYWGLVDVRDVSRAHILAIEKPEAKGRHLTCNVALKMGEVVDKLKVIAPDYKDRLPTTSLDCGPGTVMVKLGSYFEKGQVGEYIRTHIARKININHTKVTKELGLVFTPIDQTLRDTYEDLLHWGHLDAVQPCTLSDAELDAVAAQLKQTVPIADRKHGLLGHTHAASFLGNEAVTAIMKIQKLQSRTKALRVGEALLKAKKFFAKHDAAFADSAGAHFSFNASKK